jgi:hypothetical protein
VSDSPGRRSPRLLIGCVLGTACLAVLVIWVLPSLLTRHPHVAAAKDRHAALNETRAVLVAAVIAVGAAGALVYAARTYRLSMRTLGISQQTYALTQRGQFTDRYTNAVAQLGDKDNLEVRLGGIYALERLMADSPRDQSTIPEILAAWIRERTTSLTPVPQRIPTDVQAALTVLGRRTPFEAERPIDLRRTVLPKADLSAAHLENAILLYARLERALLRRVHLEGAFLGRAHLEGADLGQAHLEGAFFDEAQLQGADLGGANLQDARFYWAHLEGADLSAAYLDGAFLDGAHLEGANLKGADLGSAKGLTQSQIDSATVNERTKLPEGLHGPGAPSRSI